jgi:geranylgeranyl pyrophosphate synthase
VKTVFSVERTTEQYLDAISGKTAALMATSCRIGALTGEATRDEVEALTEFGRNFGMVFQLRDDILDVVATNGELGKPAGQDLAEGVYTLPVLHALGDPEIGPELRTLLGQPLALPERDKARAMVASSDGIAATLEVGRQFAAKANDALAGAGSAELGRALSALAESLLDDLPG